VAGSGQVCKLAHDHPNGGGTTPIMSMYQTGILMTDQEFEQRLALLHQSCEEEDLNEVSDYNEFMMGIVMNEHPMHDS